mgnify:FL=1
MREFPEPNFSTGSPVRRANLSVRICGDMAWASFDQDTPRTADSLVNVGLSHQFRVLEIHGGQWKFDIKPFTVALSLYGFIVCDPA